MGWESRNRSSVLRHKVLVEQWDPILVFGYIPKPNGWSWVGVPGCRSHLLPISRSIYKKAGLAKEKRQVTYLVAKKGVGRRVRRPPGVKGQFKVVDSRLKKDVRAQKRKEQKKKRHK